MRSRSVASLSLFSPYLPCNVNVLFVADGFPPRGLTYSPHPFSCCVVDGETLRIASQVDHFQPYYTFNKKHMTELRIGAAILHEAMQAAEKEEDEGLKVRTAKAEDEMRIKRVCSLSP